MEPRASALWVRLKANRLASSLTILLTLTVGILIGTVISYSVKGQDKKGPDVCAPDRALAAAALQPVHADFQAVGAQCGQHQHRIHRQAGAASPWRQAAGAR